MSGYRLSDLHNYNTAKNTLINRQLSVFMTNFKDAEKLTLTGVCGRPTIVDVHGNFEKFTDILSDLKRFRKGRSKYKICNQSVTVHLKAVVIFSKILGNLGEIGM